MNLPEGKKVSSPDEAHQGLTQYEFKDISSLIGFFSRLHKAVFTHHDSFFHISDDRKVLGHIDETNFNSSKVTLKVSKIPLISYSILIVNTPICPPRFDSCKAYISFLKFFDQYGIRVQCAEPVTGSSKKVA